MLRWVFIFFLVSFSLNPSLAFSEQSSLYEITAKNFSFYDILGTVKAFPGRGQIYTGTVSLSSVESNDDSGCSVPGGIVDFEAGYLLENIRGKTLVRFLQANSISAPIWRGRRSRKGFRVKLVRHERETGSKRIYRIRGRELPGGKTIVAIKEGIRISGKTSCSFEYVGRFEHY